MFRYGGPIKEGVMSGIREPHAGGGRAALVGNPVYPRTGGREHHNILKTIFGWGAKPALGVGAKEATKKTVGTETVKGIKSLWQKYGPDFRLGRKIKKPLNIKSAPHIRESIYTTKGVPFMEKAGRFVKKNPYWAAGGVGVGSQYAGDTVKTVAGLAEKIPLQIADLLVRDKYFDQDKWMKENYPEGFIGSLFSGKDKKEDDADNTTETNPWKDKYEALLEANKTPPKSDEQIRNERIQKYRDIMDIKGMNKEAAYDSLIAASKAVGESGDFKGDIKSGKLINDIIQSTSKAFDKPKKTRDAIDTLILKGEIEKDLYAAKPSEAEKAAAAFGISKEEYKKKLLGKSNAAEYIATSYAKTGRVDSTTVASGYKASGIIPKATITDTIVDDWINDNSGKTEIDYVKEVISKADGFGPGLYVVGDRAVLFDGTTYKYDY
jgi:hypothetical protein